MHSLSLLAMVCDWLQKVSLDISLSAFLCCCWRYCFFGLIILNSAVVPPPLLVKHAMPKAFLCLQQRKRSF